jgi:hypothetical protein
MTTWAQSQSILSSLPVVLPAADVSFGFTDPAGTSRGATKGFWNTEPVGVLIDKLVFSLLINFSGVDVSAVYPVPTVKLRYGNEPVTNGDLLLTSVAWPKNALYERSAPTIHFSKPFYLPPGGILDVSYTNAFFGGAPGIIRAAAIGRQALSPPPERWIPYLTSFEVENGTSAIDFISTPQDIGNPFATDLFIERVVASLFLGGGSDGPVEPNTDWSRFFARISDHRDNFWIPTPTEFISAVDPLTRSWVVNTILAAKGYLRVEISGPAIGENDQLTATIGTIGYRRLS